MQRNAAPDLRPLRLVRLFTPWARMRGLLCRRRPPGAHSGVWLAPCRAVHTLGMAYAIDVAFIDRQGKVLKAVRLAPWRYALCVRAVAVVETRAGLIVGDEACGVSRLEAALRTTSCLSKAGATHACY